jgi:hypothetical protein
MKAFIQARSLRIGVCAALAVAITVLTTQSVVQLAGQPRHSAAHSVLVAQSDPGEVRGSIRVALAR